jgi:peptidoglycan/xylan/chitin deacetylase (PgdA/CDA1 family)
VKKHTGQQIAGYLAPALTHTERTMDIMADLGLLYTCDLFIDDQPFPVNVKKGRLISIPYSLEMNDIIVYNTHNVAPRRYADMLKSNFDRLREDGKRTGTVMCIPLHAYAVSQGHRLKAFDEALQYITGHDDVWVTTGREIAQYYYAHYFDEFIEAIKRFKTKYAPRA